MELELQLPILGRVPSVHEDSLCLKVTQTGVTYLVSSKYRVRYTGSKNCAVDINGNLYLRKQELAEALGQKKTPLRKAGIVSLGLKVAPQRSDNFSTQQNEFSPNNTPLSTKKQFRGYRINKREVRQRLLGYINTQRGKKELYFWTVTFPKGTSDDMCYRIFNIWLTSLRKYKMLREYLWVAERQDNGTVHFHIAIPHRMSVQRANAMMAGTLKTFARRGDIPFTVWQCARYNGVDIAKNRKTRRVTNFAVKKGSRALSHYLTKYVTKNDTEFTHLAWHNSRGYSQLFTGITFTIEEFRKLGFGFFMDRRRVYQVGDFARFIPWIDYPPPLFEEHLYKLNSWVQEHNNSDI